MTTEKQIQMIKVKSFYYQKDYLILTAFHLANVTHLSMNNKIEEINSHIFQLSGFIAGET